MTKKNSGQFLRRQDFVHAMSDLQSRLELAGVMGKQFQGARDLFKVLGYKTQPKFQDFLAMYERHPFAKRVVDAVSGETWRKFPLLIDGASKSDDKEDGKLTSLQVAFNETRDRAGLNEQFKTLDINCGIGRFTVLFLGFADGGGNFETPLKPFEGEADPKRLAYAQPYDEGQISEIKEYVTNPADPRFGLPLMYKINMGDPEKKSKRDDKLVHWTRVIHVAEGRRRSRVFGVPRLLHLLNTLDDLYKILGSSAEAFWLGARNTFSLTTKEDAVAPSKDSPEQNDLEDEIEAFVHQLRPYMMLEGFDVNEFKASIVSPLNHFKAAISTLSGGGEIPQRILTGSERGELASDQDDKNFADNIAIRQAQFAEPQIVRAFTDRMIDLNVFPDSIKGDKKYSIEWPSLFELNDEEKADVAYKVGQTLSVMAGAAQKVLPPEVFFGFINRYFGFLGISDVPLRDLPNLSPEKKKKDEKDQSNDATQK